MQRIKIKGPVKELKMLSFYLLSLTGWLVLAITFLWGYIYGGNKVTINSIGEANLELFFVVGVTVFCLYGLVFHVKNLRGFSNGKKTTL